jgi:nicotinamide mononucleotide transporter
LLIKENIYCWFFGIGGSLLSIYIFYSVKLYSEAILYIYYVFIGIYGYLLWRKKESSQNELTVNNLSNKNLLLIVGFGIVISLIVGYIFSSYTEAVNPYLDALTTVFSLIASFLEAKKILTAWILWLFINFITIFLYLQQSLTLYVFLTVVYFIFSAIGYVNWKKSYNLVKIKSNIS